MCHNVGIELNSILCRDASESIMTSGCDVMRTGPIRAACIFYTRGNTTCVSNLEFRVRSRVYVNIR